MQIVGYMSEWQLIYGGRKSSPLNGGKAQTDADKTVR